MHYAHIFSRKMYATSFDDLSKKFLLLFSDFRVIKPRTDNIGRFLYITLAQ
jgi:hypothetical protein